MDKDNKITKHKNSKPRFNFIDQFRGLIIILMLVDHSSYYFNSIWLYLDPFDPVFNSWGQFALRYISYLCAPGFLMMAGAMIWWSYAKKLEKGANGWTVRWQLIQRGLFLVLLQITWVNSSWGGFQSLRLWHFGIIGSIGVSMILLTFIVSFKWYIQLFIALAILVVHPFLLEIPYNHDDTWQQAFMQTFVDAGKFNKYPVLPWFAMAILGSVMAHGWLKYWKTDKARIINSLIIASIAFILAIGIRMGRGYGNILSFSDFGSYSFFFDQKYPPSLHFSLWWFACVVVLVTLFIAIGKAAPKLLLVFDIPGKVALFFYLMHIAIMGVFVKRMDFLYREGEVFATLIGVVVMLVIMIPLSKWYFRLKQRSNNYFIRMI